MCVNVCIYVCLCLYVCVCVRVRSRPYVSAFQPWRFSPGIATPKRNNIPLAHSALLPTPGEKESKRKNKEQYRKVNISCICVFCCRETLKDVCMRPGSLISPPAQATSSSVGLQLGGTMRDGRTLRSSALANNGTGDDREEK